MNVLFANYGDFTSNSLNHIAPFARELTRLGHACAVAVPEDGGTLSAIASPAFAARTFDELRLVSAPTRDADAAAEHGSIAPGASALPLFPDRRPADVLHAWTPRDNVRTFALTYLHAHPRTALVIHLEDNEDHLAAAYARRSVDELRDASDEETAVRLSPRLAHPDRATQFLALAHGVTHITAALAAELPEATPRLLLPPGVETAIYHPQAADPALRASLGIAPTERVIVYPGGTNFANLADIRALLEAVALLRSAGHAVRLVRTGIHPAELDRQLGADLLAPVVDLGFVVKARLGPLLALADVLVQPGAPGPYNDLRLPSKLPEFLASGRPVVLAATNIGLLLRDGEEGLLHDGTPAGMAAACSRIFDDPALATRLGLGGAALARRHFDLAVNTAALAAFYRSLLPPAPVFPAGAPSCSDDVLYARRYAPALVARRLWAKERSLTAVGETLTSARDEIRQLTADLASLRIDHTASLADLASAREAQRHLTAELTATRAWLAMATQRSHTLAAEQAATQAELTRARDKIARLQHSLSWRLTAPVRALRRALLDPLRRRGSGRDAPPLHRPSATARDQFHFHLDQPTDLGHAPLAGTLHGWVITVARDPIFAVRLVEAASGPVTGRYGLPRPDVALLHPGATAQAGFSIHYRCATTGRHEFTLEAQLAPEVWTPFARLTMETSAAASTSVDYPQWLAAFAATMQPPAPPVAGPLISILVPVYNPPEPWLRRCLESVLAQTYARWELCVADDASTASHVRTILADFAARDARIKVVHREANGHICAASNSALALATGDFIALLDHDDELAPTALAHITAAIAAHPTAVYVYSDEDKIDTEGRRFDPHLKPAWNPELLRGQNYCSHLSVFRTDRVHALGGFRAGTEGSQDWDLVLRVTEDLPPAAIVHVPHILYHWRAIPGSTATGHEQKDYATSAAARVLRDHVARTRLDGADVLPVPGGHWRIRRPRPSPAPLVSVIIPTRDALPLVRLCLDSLRAHTTYPNFEVLLVDNQSRDPAALAAFADYERDGTIRLLRYNLPFNYAALNNWAATQARGELLLFLNNDIEVRDGTWLDELVNHAVRPEIGAVGARLLYPDGHVQHAGVTLGIAGPREVDGVAGHPFKGLPRDAHGYFNRLQLVQDVSAVTAACLAMRAAVFREVGGFDERELAVAFNDVDLCLKVLAAGYRNVWTPFAELIHHESATRGAEDTPEKVARFNREVATMRARWGPLLDADPAYHPLLTLVHEDFSLAWPLRAGADRRPRAGGAVASGAPTGSTGEAATPVEAHPHRPEPR